MKTIQYTLILILCYFLSQEPPSHAMEIQPYTPQHQFSTKNRSHNNKLYPCKKCSKNFFTNNLRIIHERVHTGEQPFSCNECGKNFNQKGNLTTHMRLHTGEKNYACTYCTKKFIQKSNHDYHVATVHMNKRTYLCPECPKKFSQRCHLEDHKKIHTGKKDHSCEICDTCFIQKSSLIRHIKDVHAGEKDYFCEHCPKAFISNGDRNHHMKTCSKRPMYIDAGTLADIENRLGNNSSMDNQQLIDDISFLNWIEQ